MERRRKQERKFSRGFRRFHAGQRKSNEKLSVKILSDQHGLQAKVQSQLKEASRKGREGRKGD